MVSLLGAFDTGPALHIGVPTAPDVAPFSPTLLTTCPCSLLRLPAGLPAGLPACTVMEFVAGGQLFDRAVELGTYSEVDAACVVYRLVSTLDFLHEHGVMHRDLKPENIMLAMDSNTDIKLIDFGMSSLTEGLCALHSKCGTPVYMAPELFSGNYDMAVDIWAGGVILFILLSGVL
eukprot:COSAG06_NODE_29214_length_560_cov_1.234273_1_plen_175_part_01